MRIRKILVFLAVVLSVLAVTQLYVAVSVSRWLDLIPMDSAIHTGLKGTLLALLLVLNLSIPLRIFLRGSAIRSSKVLQRLILLPGFTWHLTAIWMSMLLVAKDLSLKVIGLIYGSQVLENHSVIHACNAVTIGAPLIMAGYGALKTARDYRVERINLEFSQLPSGLNGLTIAQVSDIHSGIYMSEREMNKILEILNSLHAGIAVLTGDYVDSRASEIAPVARVFSQIRTEYGIFGCMGNHDLFDDYPVITKAMREKGIRMLDNESAVIKADGDVLNVLGVGDRDRRYNLARFDQALEGVDPDGFKVVLAHRPNLFPEAVKAGIDLQLSGHTHGGQVGIKLGPFSFSPADFVGKYSLGHYEEGKSQLYVNPGVGMVFAPVRFGIRPEITLITLNCKG
jgi:predicted MPP superfamily phosphohydrolase